MKTKRNFFNVLICFALVVTAVFAGSCAEINNNTPTVPTAKENAATLSVTLSASIDKIYEIALETNVATTDAQITSILVSHESDFKTLLNDKDKIYALKTELANGVYANIVNEAVTAYDDLKNYAVNNYVTTTPTEYEKGVKAKYDAAKNEVNSLKILVLAETNER